MMNEIAPARPSATVMLLRPASPGFEVFMVRRHPGNRFMPDLFVFPGGRLEEADWQPATLAKLYGLNLSGQATLFRDLPGQGAYGEEVILSVAQEIGLYVAAIRELFEEAGVLLAVKAGGELVVSWEEVGLNQWRQALQQGQLSFATMLEQAGLWLDLSHLTYFSHWITPVTEPYRFDTRFFLAEFPAGQLAESDHLETTEGVWITPQTALDRYAAGDFKLAFPTLLHVQWLNQYSSLDQVRQAAAVKPVVTILPDRAKPFTFQLGEW